MPRTRRTRQPRATQEQASRSIKEQDALRMRAAGKSLVEISEALEMSVSGVSRMLTRALERTETEAPDEYRELQMRRLELLLRGIWQRASSGDDEKATLAALKILERMDKLQGLERPVKVAPTTPDGESMYPSELNNDSQAMRVVLAALAEMSRSGR